MKIQTSINYGTRTGKAIAAILLFSLLPCAATMAQEEQHAMKANATEEYGNTLNLGLGAGYYGYLQSHSAPIVFANYEFDISRGFTLAPFIGFSTSNGSNVYRNGYYSNYHETVVPVGVKGTYYFDELLDLNKKWDLYAALSLGLVYDAVSWNEDFNGGSSSSSTSGHFDAELHIGGEYHFNRRLGLFADLSTGVSSIGLAIHQW